MTPEELKEIEDRYNSLVNDEAVKENLLREMCIAIVDAGKLLAHIKELESRISEHERRCSLRTLADGMKKLCPDLVEELIKRVNGYNKKEDGKFSEILTWLKGKEDESSGS